MSGTAPGRSSPAAISAVVAAGVIAACHMGKMPGALPVLREELGLTLTDGAWLLSMFNALGLACAMLVGAIGDRLGHRRMMLTGLATVTAGSVLGAMADSFAALLATRIIEGLGFIVAIAVAPALFLRDTATRHRGLVFGFWGGYWPAGMAVMTALTPWLIASTGWRGLWLTSAALSLAALAAVALLTRADGPPAGAGNAVLDNVRRTASSRGPWLLALGFCAYSSIHVAFVSLLPSFYTETDGLTLGVAATLTAVIAAANVAGNIGGGLALHRGVARWRLLASVFALLALLSVLCFADALPVTVRVTAALLLSACAGVIPACLLAGAPVHAPAPFLVGATTGLIMQGAQLGQFVGPVAMAWTVALAGTWNAAPLTLAAAALAGIGLALAIRAAERPA